MNADGGDDVSDDSDGDGGGRRWVPTLVILCNLVTLN